MTNKEITKVIFNNAEISALYYGDVLVWEKENTEEYGVNTFAGKFTDDSTESDWAMYKFGSPNDYTKVIIPVDTETKEFNYELEWSKNYDWLSITRMPSKIQHIYHLPYNLIINSEYGLRGIFDGCSYLETCNLNGLKGHNFTDVSFLFNLCEKLKSIGFNLDGLNVTIMDNTFYGCSALSSLDLSSFNTAACTNMNSTFYGCTKLTTVTGVFEGTKVDLDLHYSPLTNESAMVFINGLANVGETKTIKFKSTTYNTLTPEQIAIATSKGWTVISA